MKEVFLESAAFSNWDHKGFDRKPLLKEHESVIRAFFFFFFFASCAERIGKEFSILYLHRQAKFQITL